MSKIIYSKSYFFLFGISFTLLLILFYATGQNRNIFTILQPLTLCFLLWSFKYYTFKTKVIIAVVAASLGFMNWGSINPLSIYTFMPMISAIIALVVSKAIDKK